MKKSILIIILSTLFYPFLRAQNPGDLDIVINTYQCDSTNNFDAATGCTYWISNANGDTVYQDAVPSFTQNWGCFVPYNDTNAPYFVNFDSICLNSNGVNLDTYSFQIPNIHPVGNMFWADSVIICENMPSSMTFSGAIYFGDCDTITGADNTLAIGCTYWIEDANGPITTPQTITSSGNNYFIGNFSFATDNTVPPYTLRFDQNCLNANGLTLQNYNIPFSGSYTSGNSIYDTLTLCAQNQLYDSVYANVFSNCDSLTDLGMAQGCDYWISNAMDNIVYQSNIPAYGSWGFAFPYDSLQAPYFINFDTTCLNANGVVLDNYIFEITNIHTSGTYNYLFADSIIVCNNTSVIDTITYSGLIVTAGCDSIPAANNALAAGCGYWVEDVNGNTVFQTTIGNLGSSFLLGSYSFTYDSLSAPYSLHFDQTCLNTNGVIFDNYTFALNQTSTGGGSIMETINICTHMDSSFVNDSCVDLYSSVSPWIGYFQNYTNYIRFEVGNNSNLPQSVTVEITMPPNVTPITSSFGFPYTVSGSILTLNTVIPAYSTYMDVIKFFVPSGISDGTLHVYGIDIYNNDSNVVDCNQWNNQDTLHQVVGNSYDPNAKTVALPEKIAAATQDEFVYTIYFQNLGTAPAQDIYIIDTLSNNLDWSTFEFLRSSHVVGISDLGNGVKKFYFNGIWLPDSTTNAGKSTGFVSFKIKEKLNNSAGTEIMNTAYIYFDQNPAVVTNTTYNINVENLGLDDLSQEINVKLFPNPANESVNIKADNRIDNIEIYAVDGKLCWSSKPNQSEVKLNISDFNSGLYLVRIQSQETTKTLRFIKN